MAGPRSADTTRRDVLARFGAATAALVTPRLLTGAASAIPVSASRADASPSLAALARAKGLELGASFAVHELDSPYGARYAEAYARDCAAITSELEFKMDALRPRADTIDFAGADRLVAFAEQHKLRVRGHTLIWNDFLPEWVHRLSPGEVEHLLEAHIETVIERYRGRVAIWDVVNEPIGPWDRLPGNLRKGPFLTALGEGYIARAFRTARRMDPGATLVLNEAQTETADENGQTFRDSLLALLKRLKAEAVPIDAVGLQSHLWSDKPYDMARFTGFLDDIAALGYAIHITELDVNDRAYPLTVSRRDRKVADLYTRFLTPVLAHKAVTSLTFWQLSDRTSWLWYAAGQTSPRATRRPRPLPLDESFSRKPAWHAVADALRAMPPR